MTQPPRGELNRRINGMLGLDQTGWNETQPPGEPWPWDGPDFERDIAATIAVCIELGWECVPWECSGDGDWWARINTPPSFDRDGCPLYEKIEQVTIRDNNYPRAAAEALAGMLEQSKENK